MRSILGPGAALAVSVVFLASAGSGSAQTLNPDNEGEFVAPGASATINQFGQCVVVHNSGSVAFDYEFKSEAEWDSWVNSPPDPGVTYGSCDCGTLTEGQTTTVTSTVSQSCPAPDSGTETATVTTLETCRGGTLVVTGPPSTGPFNTSQCLAPAASCTDSQGNTHSSGSIFDVISTTSESCTEAGFGAGATGTATATTTTTEECTNGSITVLASSTGPENTSQCVNSAGGACMPVTQAQCTTLNTTQPDPLCEWTAAAPGPVQSLRGEDVGWTAFEFQAVLTYQPSANLCSCVGTPTAVGEVKSETVDIAPPPNTAVPPDLEPPACPNGSGTCIVQPQGSCD